MVLPEQKRKGGKKARDYSAQRLREDLPQWRRPLQYKVSFISGQPMLIHSTVTNISFFKWIAKTYSSGQRLTEGLPLWRCHLQYKVCFLKRIANMTHSSQRLREDLPQWRRPLQYKVRFFKRIARQ
jgi:hypothetical protein